MPTFFNRRWHISTTPNTTKNVCTLHRGAFYKFPFRWIYYCHSSKSTGKETGKTHLCALHCLNFSALKYSFGGPQKCEKLNFSEQKNIFA